MEIERGPRWSALRSVLVPVAIAGVGVLLGRLLPRLAEGADDGGRLYGDVTGALLAVGLYASVYGISRPHARRDLARILVAITFGVLVKAALIAAVLALVFRGRTEYLILAAAMAQIDPLSVSALMDRRDMSLRAKSLLAAWASFDDPVTTVLVVYVSALVLDDASSFGAGATAYGGTLLLNLALLAVAAVVWAALGRPWRGRDAAGQRPPVGRGLWAGQVVALVVLLAVASWQFLMLGLAVAALFFRPALGKVVDRAVQVALTVATLLLGVLLTRGVDVGAGLVLGAATFAAQIVVGAVVSVGFPRRDRIALCLSQQNGITAIILALLLQPMLPRAVAIVAPAILTVNVLHAVANAVPAFGRRLGRAPVVEQDAAAAPEG
ncbi:hypothetical protein [Streptomyces sp. SID3343]|uniref:hypothetical protein n=1 Tax=Streptomyces sp. SID3343 TaxID=2690260 RepID=UPI00136D8856|nr:hypothetical protein [Streptomyces sp. SID3343]MYW05134.1 hypothetical protein [Streptomyces sp. SID3343]